MACAELVIASLGGFWPIVRAERRGGEVGGVVEIAACRVVGPGVAHGDGLRYLRVGQQNGVAINLGVGPDELLVRSSDGKVFRRTLFGGESCGVAELHADGVAFELHRVEAWAARLDGLGVNFLQSDEREAFADILFVMRMDRERVAEFDADGDGDT